ncbi:VanZ family protein [Amycolatopsis sp. FDAARGOS 1241]|uniref:VanZ family protein n=1 Tax=Amycolatopsis sp. FDAARGOS 1241 TaxID=2778070 RepID=UPI001952155B|nr:VanZ family protein [Amycolatopsis sp. FDAARGOS 1241]QRP48306.1 VanZ family protein [Amycolatopsis sp. FDAARGOS 1241]
MRSRPRALLAIAVFGVLTVTLCPGHLAPPENVNLVPFAGIVDEAVNVSAPIGVLNNAGNVLLFVPLGFLAAFATRRRAAIVPVLAGFSAAIEAAQYFVGRSADVDDVLLNTLGAALGVALTAVVRSRARKTSA